MLRLVLIMPDGTKIGGRTFPDTRKGLLEATAAADSYVAICRANGGSFAKCTVEIWGVGTW